MKSYNTRRSPANTFIFSQNTFSNASRTSQNAMCGQFLTEMNILSSLLRCGRKRCSLQKGTRCFQGEAACGCGSGSHNRSCGGWCVQGLEVRRSGTKLELGNAAGGSVWAEILSEAIPDRRTESTAVNSVNIHHTKAEAGAEGYLLLPILFFGKKLLAVFVPICHNNPSPLMTPWEATHSPVCLSRIPNASLSVASRRKKIARRKVTLHLSGEVTQVVRPSGCRFPSW